ncbi:hypothetical protein F5Y05DRAFT_413178 [Hypoxylon sp. FL0543]|nr:hypothetical protein F5Y05DRAFT_413178 [Hypoxylon sp. FL0543]
MSGAVDAVRKRATSRIALKPKRGEPLPAANDGTGQRNMNLLIYMKNLQKAPGATAKESVSHLLHQDILSRMGNMSIGFDYERGNTTHVYGNRVAGALLDEFNDTIDYARSLEDSQNPGATQSAGAVQNREATQRAGAVQNPGATQSAGTIQSSGPIPTWGAFQNFGASQNKGASQDKGASQNPEASQDSTAEKVKQQFSDVLGDEFVGNRSVETLVGISLIWAKRYMLSRARNLAQYTFYDFTSDHPKDVFDQNYLRRDTINKQLHSMSLEEDIVWSSVQDIDRTDGRFTNSQDWVRSHFEALYRVRINEAIALVRHAHDPRDTDRANFFSWCIILINQFTKWRGGIQEVYIRQRYQFPEGYLADQPYWYRVRRYADGRWENQGGRRLDYLYEEFLHQLFRNLEVAERGEHASTELNQAFTRDKNAFLDALQSVKRNAFFNAGDKAFANISGPQVLDVKFPDTVPKWYSQATRPAIPLEFLPPAQPVEFPRQPVVVNPAYFVSISPRTRRTAQNPMPPGGGGGSNPYGNMARAIPRGIDSPYDEETEPETEPETEEEYEDQSRDEGGYYIASALQSRQKRSSEGSTPGKRVSFANEEPWVGIKLEPAPPPKKRRAPESDPVASPSKRPRRLAVSE